MNHFQCEAGPGPRPIPPRRRVRREIIEDYARPSHAHHCKWLLSRQREQERDIATWPHTQHTARMRGRASAEKTHKDYRGMRIW